MRATWWKMPRFVRTASEESTRQNRELWKLCVSIALSMSAYFAAFTLAPLLAVELGMSTAAVGAIVSLTFVAPMLLAIPLGTILDLRGPRPFMLIGAAMVASLSLAVVLWPVVPTLAMMQIGLGLAQIQLMLAGQSLAAAIGTGEHRARNFGYYTTAVSAGQLLGPLVAGVGAEVTSIPGAFVLVSGLALAALVSGSTLGVGKPVRGELAVGTPRGSRAEIRKCWADPAVRFAMFASGSVLLAIAVNQALLPVLMREGGVTPAKIGLLFSVQGLAAMAIRPFLGALGRQMRSTRELMMIVVSCVSIGIALIAAQSALAALVFSMVLLGAGSGVSQPLSMIMVLDQVQASKRGLVLGLRISVNRLAQVVGPAGLGLVASFGGIRAAYAVTAVVALVIVLPAWWSLRQNAALGT